MNGGSIVKMITAVIPVREGSRRVKGKNIKPFAEKSLLQYKIEQLKRIDQIDEIVVSSDSEKMLSLAKSLGVKAIKRPIEYCDEKSKTFNQVVRYIASNQVMGDVMIWAPCVCPLLKDDSLKEGIEIFNSKKEIDSVVSAKRIQEYIFDENGPINFSVENHVTSQNLPKWHVIVNGFFIAKRKDMEKWGFVYGERPYLYEIEKIEAIDIDDEFDFEMAEFFMKRKG